MYLPNLSIFLSVHPYIHLPTDLLAYLKGFLHIILWNLVITCNTIMVLLLLYGIMQYDRYSGHCSGFTTIYFTSFSKFHPAI